MPERFEEEEVPVPERTVKLAEPVSVTGRQNDRFRAAVATAVERMKAGELSKIVLARAHRPLHPRRPGPRRAV